MNCKVRQGGLLGRKIVFASVLIDSHCCSEFWWEKKIQNWRALKRHLGISVEEEQGDTKEASGAQHTVARLQSSPLIQTTYENSLKIISVCVYFPTRWLAAMSCCSCGAARLHPGSTGGGASPRHQEYKSPTIPLLSDLFLFRTGLWVKRVQHPSQISPRFLQPWIVPEDETQTPGVTIRMLSGGICNSFSPWQWIFGRLRRVYFPSKDNKSNSSNSTAVWWTLRTPAVHIRLKRVQEAMTLVYSKTVNHCDPPGSHSWAGVCLYLEGVGSYRMLSLNIHPHVDTDVGYVQSNICASAADILVTLWIFFDYLCKYFSINSHSKHIKTQLTCSPFWNVCVCLLGRVDRLYLLVQIRLLACNWGYECSYLLQLNR